MLCSAVPFEDGPGNRVVSEVHSDGVAVIGQPLAVNDDSANAVVIPGSDPHGFANCPRESRKNPGSMTTNVIRVRSLVYARAAFCLLNILTAVAGEANDDDDRESHFLSAFESRVEGHGLPARRLFWRVQSPYLTRSSKAVEQSLGDGQGISHSCCMPLSSRRQSGGYLKTGPGKAVVTSAEELHD